MAEDDISDRSAVAAPSAETGSRREEFREGTRAAPVGPESARSADAEPAIRRLLAELASAAATEAEGLLDAHKRLAAEQMAGIADAVRRTGRSVDQTESRLIAEYGDRAAARLEAAADAMRERGWGEIAADIEAFGRKRPVWLVLGALAGGFALSRLIAAAAVRERQRERRPREPAMRREAEAARVEEVF